MGKWFDPDRNMLPCGDIRPLLHNGSNSWAMGRPPRSAVEWMDAVQPTSRVHTGRLDGRCSAVSRWSAIECSLFGKDENDACIRIGFEHFNQPLIGGIANLMKAIATIMTAPLGYTMFGQGIKKDVCPSDVGTANEIMSSGNTPASRSAVAASMAASSRSAPTN